ncbi:hypothetical protein AB0J83_25685 [Actinoplanes sp. NPDC049596]|uniref:hypothetical protein n=1 Tax=unclassified Actinoplanes TaxID=2626549 RepID=UPI0034322740
MTDSEHLKTRPGCLWWLITLTAMLAGCVGLAAVVETMPTQCRGDHHFTLACASRVAAHLTGD